MNAEYRVLEQASFNGETVSIDGGFKDVISSLTVVLVVVILLAVFIRFTVALAYAVNTASPASKLKAKEDFRKGVVGLILGLLFISGINYINPNFVTLSWDALKSSTSSTTVPGPGTGPGPGPGITPGGPRDFEAVRADEARVRGLLSGITITGTQTTAPCSQVGQRGCTTVGTLGEPTIQMLLSLKSTCRCNITITGGTEWWSHSENTKHVPGGNAVDLSITTNLTDYIKRDARSAFIKLTNPPSWCNEAYTWSGFLFCDEKNTAAHWHVEKR